MSVDIYKYAAEKRLRFPSTRGDLVVEQLFELPLTSKTGFDLDTVAKTINGKLKAVTEESFVATSTNPQQPLLTVALDVVKDVIATKQAEAKAMAEKAAKAAMRRDILDAMAAKEKEGLSKASMDELKKRLDELEG